MCGACLTADVDLGQKRRGLEPPDETESSSRSPNRDTGRRGQPGVDAGRLGHALDAEPHTPDLREDGQPDAEAGVENPSSIAQAVQGPPRASVSTSQPACGAGEGLEDR